MDANELVQLYNYSKNSGKFGSTRKFEFTGEFAANFVNNNQELSRQFIADQ